MRVIVIPEDFSKDQYILKPMVTAMMEAVGRPHAIVVVCQNPLLGGVGEALKWERIEEILRRYPMTDLFLLCIDRDGKEGRRASLDNIEAKAAGVLMTRQLFLAENAWQEIEAWVLAGHDLPVAWRWQDIRREVQCKEVYFIPLATERRLLKKPGEGRKILAAEAADRYGRIRNLCPEVADLEQRIRTWIGGGP